MKIITKCPVRVSLAGGSTDSPRFIEKHNRGSVISFTPNLFTYTSVFQDVNGFNNFNKEYILSYSRNERTPHVSEIKNHLIKEALNSISTPPCKITFDSDIFSSGSGLAVSSSYTLGIVNSLNIFKGLAFQTSDACKKAFDIEKKVNPYNGYQDTYGVAYGGLKRLNFNKDGTFSIKYLNPWVFKKFNFYLVYTEIKRESSSILKTIDIDKSLPLLEEVDKLEKDILNQDASSLLKTLNNSWRIKKEGSPLILKDPELVKLDEQLQNDSQVHAHKLCGAGGGGYFLVVTDKVDSFNFKNPHPWIKIDLDTKGISTLKI